VRVLVSYWRAGIVLPATPRGGIVLFVGGSHCSPLVGGTLCLFDGATFLPRFCSSYGIPGQVLEASHYRRQHLPFLSL
jgi:hypothetical protein